MNTLVGVRNAAQQDRVVGGTAVLAQRMADSIGDALVLDAPVRRIDVRGTGVDVTSDPCRVHAGRVIVAVPPVLAGRISYTPALPPLRDQLTQNMPAGSVIKINVAYDEPFWRADGLSGQAAGDVDVVKFTFDNSPPAGRPGVLVCFLEGREARELGMRSPADRRAEVLRCLTTFFGPRAAQPVDYVELDWSAEEWTRGCYGAHLAPGVWTGFGRALREPIGQIHFAGTETAGAWNGYMDGALTSGERAAAEVLAAS